MIKNRFGARIMMSTILSCAVVALIVSVVAIYNNISSFRGTQERQRKTVLLSLFYFKGYNMGTGLQ